ncbi:aminopeptidase P family protein [Prolixibacteraceae bacterium Z1-6]|uniref:Aminopeptidase P family protein n=1 Tax=Draconibacterium aestuarii TaxID=2998507 RepID=A0A9X3J6R0_9BACT|nr:aminopeptidase P family protein [Prolixibacteraceae bacterium Z1-6]
MSNTIKERLSALRAEMQKLNIDAWYISGTDPHASEYLPARWQTRAFISGFTGSYGMVVVTQNEAALWTDSRYFLQAAEQLEGTGIEMMKLRVPDSVSPEEWLCDKLYAGSRVGMDAQTVSVAGFKSFERTLAKHDVELVETTDLLENIWTDRPLDLAEKVFEPGVEYAGVSRVEKQVNIAAELQKPGADYQVVSMLDELAWLYNLRGNDINYNPVFNGFGFIGKNESFLFVENSKVDAGLKATLENDGVQLKEYSEFYAFLATVSGKKILVDPSSLNYSAYSALVEQNELLEGTSVVSLQKARKNETEIAGFKEAMKKDGVALIEFLNWLKNSIGKKTVSEYEIGLKLREFRAKQDGFKGESFPPIVGYKSHGAIVHLSVGPDDALPVEAEGILLFDSGGQYLDGTTDITRTCALGEITGQQKTDFTIVLKGMIGLTNAKFPYGTKGCHLDILARRPMWEHGMNYGHGTGHGVGHFLNVHEGPMAIRQEYNENKIEPGHVLSNEPAFYREGLYGIRTENMMVCVEKEETEFGRFLGFDTLTLCPIDTTLIRVDLLSAEEIDWLNNYHKKVNAELKPLLSEEFHGFLDELTVGI